MRPFVTCAFLLAACSSTEYRQETAASQRITRVQPDATGKVTWVTTMDEQTLRVIRTTTTMNGDKSDSPSGLPQVSHVERLWLCTAKGDGDRPLCVQPDWSEAKDGTPPPAKPAPQP